MELSHIHLTRSTMALSIKVIAVLGATIAIYFQDLNIIFNDALQNEATSHILAIPLLFAYLIFRKRKMLRAVIPFETANQPKQTKHLSTLVGALLCTTAIILYWRGSYTFTPMEYHVLTLPIFTAGLTLLLFNPQTLRQLAFPIIFLIFLMPPPSEILYSLGSTLSVLSSEASNRIVNTVGILSTISVEYGNPTIIITRPDKTTVGFTIDIACSGIYSLIGFLIFAAFIAYIAQDKAWKKTTIILLGLPLIYLLNIIRITVILLIGYQYGEQLALQVFHLIGGWTLIFLGTLLLLATIEKLFKTKIFTKSQPIQSCPKCNPNPPSPTESFCSNCGRLLKYPKMKLRKSDIAKIVTIAAAVTLLLSIQAPVFALTEAPAHIIIQTPTGEQGNTQILPKIPGYTTKFIYRDKKFEEISQQDASLIYAYIPTNRSEMSIWITIEIAKTKSSLHPWENCLEVTQLSLRDVRLLQNPPIIGRYFTFRDIKTNLTQVILYWYENAFFNTSLNLEQKHVKISLIAYPKNSNDFAKTEKQLLQFGKAIANYWQPIKTWSQITLTISQHGKTVIAIITTLLVITLAYQALKNQKEKKSNLKVYNKLVLQEKLILQAAHQVAKKQEPSGNAIASYYQKIAGKPIELEPILKKLNEAEEAGLIKKKIASREDEPILTWKTQISFPKPSIIRKMISPILRNLLSSTKTKRQTKTWRSEANCT